MKNHLAIFSDMETIEKILHGQKTIEVRLSQKQIVPYKKVVKDDIIYLKLAGGDIIGQVMTNNVLYFDRLNSGKIKEIRNNYCQEVAMDESFWYNKKLARYASLIFLKNPSRFLTPLRFAKRDKRGWVVLENDLR